MDGTIGEIRGFAGNFAPLNWALCDGATLAISSNQALFTVIGSTYGGDGRTTFMLPDLRGRVPVSMGQGPGLSNYNWGSKGGSEYNTLTQASLPSHTHTAVGSVKASSAAGTVSDPNGGYPSNGTVEVTKGVKLALKSYGTTTNENMASDGLNITIGSTGGNQPVNNLQPYLTINWIICLEGEYPSRS